MENRLYKKNARKIRVKALAFTAFFYVLIAGAIAFNGDSEKSLKDYMPEQVKNWIDGEEVKDDDKTKGQSRA